MCDVTSRAGRKPGDDAETDGLMRSDAEIRNDVVDELRWDPQILEPDAIGVAVTDGAVTLTGHVPTYAQKLAAVRAAERVEGVKAVANEIKVELAGMGRDDADIVAAIARILEWNVQIPEGAVHGRVESGWVILAGEVRYDFQRREVERMVRQVRGVTGVTNAITVKPPASPAGVRTAIGDALRRAAEVAACQIRVEVSGRIAKLYRHVHSMREAAAAAPGVASVESHLVVTP
jgi:osmotically-inducible protein OsmY